MVIAMTPLRLTFFSLLFGAAASTAGAQKYEVYPYAGGFMPAASFLEHGPVYLTSGTEPSME